MKFRVDESTPKFREADPRDDMMARISKMSREQMVEEYRKTKPGDAWGDMLGWALSQQQPGESPEARDKRIGKGEVSAVPPGYSALAGFADVGNYGLADELSAGLDALLGKRTYEQGLANARLQQREAADTNPKSYTTGQVAGTVPLAAQAALATPATSTLGGSMLASAAGGAAQGAAYGAGSGEGLEGRLWEALNQGLFGAALGGAAPLVGRAVGAASGKAMDMWRNRGDENKALKALFDMFDSQRMTTGEAGQRLTELGDQGMLADVSPGMQVEAAGTAAASPAAADIMSPRLDARYQGNRPRTRSLLDNTMGPYRDPQAITDAVEATQKSTGTAYDLAKTQIVDPEPAIEILRQEMKTFGPKSDTGKALQQFYSQLVDDTGHPIGQGNIVHGVRQELDAALRGGVVKNTGPFRRVRNALDEALKTQVKGFKEADETWSGAQRTQEAFDWGQREMLTKNTSPGQAAKRWNRMTDPEKVAARSGTRANLEVGALGGQPNAAGRLERTLDQSLNDEKVRMVMPDAQRYAQLRQGLDNEATFNETNNLAQAARGSRTAPVMQAAANRWGVSSKMSDLANAAGDVAVATAIGGPVAGVTAAGARGVGALARRGASRAQQVSDDIIRLAGDMITRQGADAQGVLQMVERVAQANGLTRSQANSITQTVTGLLRGAVPLGAEAIRGASPIGVGGPRR